MKKFGVVGILAALGVKLSNTPIANRGVVPPVPDFSHDANVERPRPKKKDGRRAVNRFMVRFRESVGVFINPMKGWRHERQQTGITARQQRIKKRNAQGCTKNVIRRRVEAANRNQRIGRKAAQLLDRNSRFIHEPPCNNNTPLAPVIDAVKARGRRTQEPVGV
jgi:hypothetical protein